MTGASNKLQKFKYSILPEGRNLLTWQVDKKIPGGMNVQDPLEFTMIFVGKALLKAVEAELYKSISGVHILIRKFN